MAALEMSGAVRYTPDTMPPVNPVPVQPPPLDHRGGFFTGVLITFLLFVALGYAAVYLEIVKIDATFYKTQQAADVAAEESQQLLPSDSFYYFVETRSDFADGEWQSRYDIFSLDPSTMTETLISRIPPEQSVYDTVYVRDGAVYTLDRRNQKVLSRLTSGGAVPFITMPEGRLLNDIQILEDGRFLVVTSDAWMGESARNSKLELYTKEGDRVLSTIPVSEKSKKYSGVRILAVNEGSNIAYVSDAGGDGGVGWGTLYSVRLDTGDVRELGEYTLEENGTRGFYPGLFNPSGTFAALLSRGTDAQPYTLELTNIATGAVTKKDVSLAPEYLYVRSWLNDSQILLIGMDSAYVFDIDTGTVRTLSAQNDAVMSVALSSGSRYVALESAGERKRTVTIIDTTTFAPVGIKTLENMYPEKMMAGTDYTYVNMSFMQVP